MSGVDATLIDASNRFASCIGDAIRRAECDPSHALAVIADERTILEWQESAPDRVRALVAEGLILVPDTVDKSAAELLDARSIAEAVLFEALETTAATRGRFELNGHLSVRFGTDAAEVDLLGRQDAIAIEIDGYHHFTDAAAYRRDRRKDVLLQTQGLFVLRFLAEDVVRDPANAVNAVCQAIAFRRDQEQT